MPAQSCYGNPRFALSIADFSRDAFDRGERTISAVCPGGPARHFRVQVQSEAGGPWRSVKACVAAQTAQQDAQEWSRRGWRTRVIGYRTSPTAA